MNNKIQMVPAEQLEHHPRNPRKNIGDIEELTASVKANGILQNLTVVLVPDESEKYYVVIGNRRMEAGKAAGLKEFPCVLSDMDETEQLETMLVENMQRSDLTMLEEAEGFHQLQLCGFSVDDIAEKTGFSKSTVNRRLRLNEYKKNEAEAALERGATLADFAKLEKIKDQKDRESLVAYLGTNNFDWKFNNVFEAQTVRENKTAIRKMLKGIATEVDADLYDEWSKACKYENDEKNADIGIREPYTKSSIELRGNYEHFFCFKYGWCKFIKLKDKQKAEKADKPAHTEQQKQWERNRRQLNKMAEDAYKLRFEFVESIKERKSIKDWQNICIEYALKLGFLNYRLDVAPDYAWQKEHGMYTSNSREKDMYKFVVYCREHIAGLFAERIYNSCGDNAGQGYHHSVQWEQPKGVKNVHLSLIYEFLCKLGYEMSDEEKLWQEGKHPLQR